MARGGGGGLARRVGLGFLVSAGDFRDVPHAGETAPLAICLQANESYVPAQNWVNGGFVYGGGTMAFTAGYWALDTLKRYFGPYFRW